MSPSTRVAPSGLRGGSSALPEWASWLEQLPQDAAQRQRAAKTALYLARFAWLLIAWPLWLERLGRLDDVERLGLVKRMARSTFETFELPFDAWGHERLDPAQPYLYIANHRSWLDQPAVILAAPGLLRFLGKADYFQMPGLRHTLRLFRCVPVHKEQPQLLTARLATLLREERASLLFYPEGTRSPDGEFLDFRRGAFILAAQTGVPIAPLYLHGLGAALPRARPFWQIQPQPVGVEIGQPFDVPASFLQAPDVAPYQAQFIDAWRRSALEFERRCAARGLR